MFQKSLGCEINAEKFTMLKANMPLLLSPTFNIYTIIKICIFYNKTKIERMFKLEKEFGKIGKE